MEKIEEKLRRLAPVLTDKELQEINGLFTAYTFHRSKTRELWTTCCGKHKVIREERATAAEETALYTRHTPEPKYRWGKCTNTIDIKRRVACPWCGKETIPKELQYTGQRKNLWEYRRAVVLRQWRGALWACAYDCFKDYGRELTHLPKVKLLGVYRFAPGKAEEISRYWWAECPLGGHQQQTAPGRGHGMWELSAPYGYCGEYGTGYEVVGVEELEKSAFRYCRIEELIHRYDAIRLLTACCFYPRQIEWLVRLGLESAVKDLVEQRVKNARIIRWDAEKPGDFLPLPMREVQRLRKQCGTSEECIEALRTWRGLRGTKAEGTPEEVANLVKMLPMGRREGAIRLLRAYGPSAGRMVRYMGKRATATFGAERWMGLWIDYIEAAEQMGLDLGNEIHLLPRDLSEKHDEITAAWTALRRKEPRAGYRKRLKKLTLRYTYTDGTYLIRPPADGKEIVQEGEALHHCVGGYVERHLNGATTILFLRRRDRPGRPLCTIEVNGNTIRQIHGWDDERTACPDNPNKTDPSTLYADFLAGWLAWLKAGSRRDKHGLPIQPKRKEIA